LGLPGAAEKEEKAKDAGQQGGQSMLDSFLGGLQDAARLAGEALVTGDWAAAKEALAKSIAGTLKSLIGSVLGSMGPIGGLLSSFAGGVIDGLLKKWFGKKAEVQKVTVENVVRTLPANLNYDLAAHPGSSLFSGRAFPTGASYAQPSIVTINAAPGLGELVTIKVAGNLRLLNQSGGVR
jgi:hypothetical protein